MIAAHRKWSIAGVSLSIQSFEESFALIFTFIFQFFIMIGHEDYLALLSWNSIFRHWPWLIVKEKLGWWDVRVVVEHFEWPRVMFCSPWFCIVTTSQFPFHRIIAFLKKEVAACGAIFHETTNKERALLNLLISIDVQPSHLIGTS